MPALERRYKIQIFGQLVSINVYRATQSVTQFMATTQPTVRLDEILRHSMVSISVCGSCDRCIIIARKMLNVELAV